MAHILWDISRGIVGLTWTGAVSVYRYFCPSQEELDRKELLERVRRLGMNCRICGDTLKQGDVCVFEKGGIRHERCGSNAPD